MASPSGVSLQAFRQPSVYLVDCLKAPADVRPAVRPGPEVLSLKEPSVDLAAEQSRAGTEVTPKDECEQSEADFGNLQRTPDAIKLEPDQQPDWCDAGAENDCDCEIPKCEETKTEETDELQWSNSMLVRQEDGGGSDGLIQDFKMSPKAALICNSEERREEDDVPTPEQHEAEDEEASEPEASPQTGEKRLLNALSGLSRQLTLFAADVNEQFTQLNSRLLSMEDRLAALESKNCAGETNSKKRRRVHNPKIAEAVRRLHNSETNCRRYEPEQGLTSPHNEAVTSYLLGAMSASPDLHDADNDDIVSACKTYYETVRRNFRYKQPDLAPQAEAVKSSARSRSRRKRLLEGRQSVLYEGERELWKSATIDLMSEEEDGIVDGVSGWIVRPPSFRSQELTELCATLQSRLEATPKYRTTHHKRLQNGPN